LIHSSIFSWYSSAYILFVNSCSVGYPEFPLFGRFVVK
jgi:hypothetical protein